MKTNGDQEENLDFMDDLLAREPDRKVENGVLISKCFRTFYLILCLCVFLLLLLWVVTAFPPKWAEFKKNEKRRDALRCDVFDVKAEARTLRHNQERFLSDKYFVQKLAHEIGYAHEEEVIFQFNDQMEEAYHGTH